MLWIICFGLFALDYLGLYQSCRRHWGPILVLPPIPVVQHFVVIFNLLFEIICVSEWKWDCVYIICRLFRYYYLRLFETRIISDYLVLDYLKQVELFCKAGTPVHTLAREFWAQCSHSIPESEAKTPNRPQPREATGISRQGLWDLCHLTRATARADLNKLDRDSLTQKSAVTLWFKSLQSLGVRNLQREQGAAGWPLSPRDRAPRGDGAAPRGPAPRGDIHSLQNAE